MRRSAAGLAIAVCSACSVPTWAPKAAMIEADVVLACDYGQTAWLSHGGRWDRPHPEGGTWIETNPILGQHPSDAEVGVYLGAIAVVSTALYPVLPEWGRRALYFTLAAVETANVLTNNHHGICGI